MVAARAIGSRAKIASFIVFSDPWSPPRPEPARDVENNRALCKTLLIKKSSTRKWSKNQKELVETETSIEHHPASRSTRFKRAPIYLCSDLLKILSPSPHPMFRIENRFVGFLNRLFLSFFFFLATER